MTHLDKISLREEKVKNNLLSLLILRTLQIYILLANFSSQEILSVELIGMK